jgi:hypothetical protein
MEDNEELFAFTCSSDFQALATDLKIDKSKTDSIIDSRASRHFCPDQSKFQNYKPINRPIKTADGRIFKGWGMGDVHIGLPNGNAKTSILLTECVYSPNFAFTLISVSRIAKVTQGVNFKANYAEIMHHDGRIIARIPESQYLYRLAAEKKAQHDHANAAVTKLTIMEAHRKLGHILCQAVKHMIKSGIVTGL